MKTIKFAVGVILILFSGLGLIGTAIDVYDAATGKQDLNGDTTNIATALFSLLLMLALLALGIILIRSSDRLQTTKQILSDEDQDNLSIGVWLTLNSQEPVAGTMELNAQSRTIVITDESGRKIIDSSFDSEQIKIKNSKSLYVTAIYIITDKDKLVVSFAKDKEGHTQQRRNMWVNIIGGGKVGATYQVSSFVGSSSNDTSLLVGSNTNEYLHRWLKAHNVKSYGQILSTSAYMMIFLVSMLPLFFLILAVSIAIFDRQ